MRFRTGKRPALFRARRPTRVAFFVGSDITSHMVVNRLIPILLDSGVSVVLFLTRAKPSKSRPRTLQHLFFVEHTLLQDYAYPYVDLHGIPRPDGFNTPDGWRAIAPSEELTVRPVTNVNDPLFVSSLSDLDIDVAVSVRCYQKFKPPILDTLGGPRSGSLFVNLHPGLLPWYRGVNTFLRAMQRRDTFTGFSLHHLEPDWDTGPIIGQARFPLSYSRSVHENMMAHATDAASLIMDLVGQVAAGQSVRARPQDHGAAEYFSYPTESELDELADRGVDVFRASAVIDVLTDAFFGSVVDVDGLRDTLIEAVEDAGIPYDPHSQPGSRRIAALAGQP
jgi:hypothetical protein